MFNADDTIHMHHALSLAKRGMFTTTPNPRVGCVLVLNGNIIGTGFTQPAGQNHAEIQALQDARSHGHDPAGATAYVTLEPCSHFGRTPPCATALIEARIARVVTAMEDPNPRVSGRGLHLLRTAGIDVRCGLLEQEARELNLGFVSRMTRGTPWVRLKVAASLDGKTALYTGESQWITDQAARQDGHQWRARACAILTGIGTVRMDDPQLTVRGIETPRQPLRILIDPRLEVSLTARILSGGHVLIVTPLPESECPAVKLKELHARGIEVLHLHAPHQTDALAETPAAPTKVDLPTLMQLLAMRGINELHVEAGFKLNGALLHAQCVDELLIYLAPILLGDAHSMFHMGPLASLTQKPEFSFHHIEQIGPDLRILARRKMPLSPSS